jgi:hypothetical protein
MSDDPRDPDAEFDLGIALPTVVAIIDASRAAGELGEEAANEDVQDAENPDDNDPDALVETLKALIAELNEDEQASLIALAWVGRGDHEPDEWEEARELARERNADASAPVYLAEMELLGDLLSEGLAAFGVLAEEVAR